MATSPPVDVDDHNTAPSSSSSSSSSSLGLGLLEHKRHAGFRGQHLTSMPSDLLAMRNLVALDLAENQLVRFPGAVVATALPRLQSLALQHNQLYVLEDILALSIAPRLCELDLRGNRSLRLVEHRVYLLEAMLRAPGCDLRMLRRTQQDRELIQLQGSDAAAASTSIRRSSEAHRSTEYVTRLPRRHGFPMLQRLNDAWITDADVASVEHELGHAIEYVAPLAAVELEDVNRDRDRDGERRRRPTTAVATRKRLAHRKMTEELLQHANRVPAIPASAVVQRMQFAVDEDADDEHAQATSCVDVAAAIAGSAATATAEHAASPEDAETTTSAEDLEIVRRLYGKAIEKASTSASTARVKLQPQLLDDDETWNHPIATFDTLNSEDRQHVRLQSKHDVGSSAPQSVSTNEAPFFESSIFLDCVVQAEASRRLIGHAVRVLCPVSSSTTTPATTTVMTGAVPTLRQTLAQLTEQQRSDHVDRKIAAFRAAHPDATAHDLQEALAAFFSREQVAQRHHTTELLTAHPSRLDPSAAAGTSTSQSEDVLRAVDHSLSRLKLRNAVDLAHVLHGKTQEKRVLQVLLDADQHVIEEERVALEQAEHQRRLARIAASRLSDQEQIDEIGHDHHAMQASASLRNLHQQSPWQQRNWRAKARKYQPAHNHASDHDRDQTKKHEPTASTSGFRAIESVEAAAKDHLDTVNSHDLLVRCAEIRQHADKHARALHEYRDQFLAQEAEWEAMRHNPITIVRRHLRRKLYQDAQEIQIGSTQVFYSPLFS